MKVLIIEDELPNAKRLQKLLAETDPGIEVSAVLESITESVDWFRKNIHPDLAFMDVRLADGLSFDIFSRITVQCPVIFTTAYDEYALRAFKVNSIDYLLRPVNRDELRASLEKFRQMRQPVNNNTMNEVIAVLRQQQKSYRTRFLLPLKESWQTLMVADVAYFYSEFKITWAVLNNKQKQLLPYTLEELEDQLDPDIFFRANRQYLISSSCIAGIHNYFNGKLKVMVQPPVTDHVVISREKAPGFKKWLDR
jgi:two-component system response regulator LytT